MSMLTTLAKFLAGSVSAIVLVIAIAIGIMGSCPCCQKSFFLNCMRMRDPKKPSAFNTEIVCPQLLRGGDKNGHELSGVVVDVGTGAGASLACYQNASKITKLYLVEPMPEFREDLLKIVDFYGLSAKTEIISVGGEAVLEHIKPGTVDFVTSVHLLCSVPVNVLDELVSSTAKLLKPGGEWRAVDHRMAPIGDWRRVVQEFIAPAWAIIGNGCKFVDFVVEYPRMFPVANVDEPVPQTDASGKVKLGIKFVSAFDFPVIKPLVILHPHIVGTFKRPPVAPKVRSN